MGETFLTVMRKEAGAVKQSLWMTMQSDPGKEKEKREDRGWRQSLGQVYREPPKQNFSSGETCSGQGLPISSLLTVCSHWLGAVEVRVALSKTFCWILKLWQVPSVSNNSHSRFSPDGRFE